MLFGSYIFYFLSLGDRGVFVVGFLFLISHSKETETSKCFRLASEQNLPLS